ncbi:MAG: transcriptional repressor [Calothrix sp. FI2-JRJ7]|jgi:Fur family peroxide stress response transcriptional regulator|nr:transcriptional repressor [Calothrix sp. FI2-JRJ7]
MKELVDDIVKTLRGKGLKVTPQRFAVYANLLSRQDHPTAEQILLDLNKQAPISSQATVYSALQALRDVGLVREVLLEAGVSRYDANVEKHHHFYCRGCKTIEDIPWEAFPNVSLDKLRPGLKAQTYEVTVYGTCNCNIEH